MHHMEMLSGGDGIRLTPEGQVVFDPLIGRRTSSCYSLLLAFSGATRENEWSEVTRVLLGSLPRGILFNAVNMHWDTIDEARSRG